jgi:DNA adenine methylase
LGGKKRLYPLIVEKTESIPHIAYVEPFVGMGGVFLRRRFRPKLEVANDLNGEIVNLFRTLQRHHQQLLDVMRFQIASRRDFERLRQTDPTGLTELERAARFLYLQRLAFGGQVRGVFGVAPEAAARFSLSRLEPILEAAHERLEAVVFECLDWAELVTRYDGPETLFYLDPPYFGGENDYGKGMFDRSQYARMAAVLGQIRGAFILSINDLPEIRDIFAAFIIEPVKLKYSIGTAGATDASELIITNREVRSRLL